MPHLFLRYYMKVLSLFDGIACCRVALERVGIKVDKYYASEIDSAAITIATTNYPDIIEIGDIREVDPTKYLDVDLVTFGSPCTNFSSSGKRNGMTTKTKIDLDSLEKYLKFKEEGYEFEGQSYLFWEAVRILNVIKPKYFLMENVKMGVKWLDIVTNTLGVLPIEYNSSLVSAQNRVRLYWTNIPFDKILMDKNIKLADILEDTDYLSPAAIRGRQLNKATIVGRRINEQGHREDYNTKIPYTQCLEVRNTNRDKSNCLTTVSKDNVLTPLGIGRHIDVYGRKLPYRYYTRLEYERLQTLREGYTNCVSEAAAKKAIGNGWTVDIIAHIFKGIVE